MRLRWKLGFFIGFLILLIGVLLFFLFRENKIYFLLSEIALVLLAVVAINLHNKIFRPFNLLEQGLNALKDEDFNVKLRSTNSVEINKLVEVYNKMIDRIREERVTQQEQHYFLKLIMEALPVGVLILDFDNNLSSFNPEAKRILSLEDNHVGLSLSSIGHPLAEKAINIPLNTPSIEHLDGVQYYRCLANRFMHRGFPRKFIIIEEISDEIIRTEKKAYGKVIRMMAHEVNNTVGAVNSILDSLLKEENLNEQEAKEYLQIIFDRNIRLNQFMANFAEVVRLPPPSKKKIDLNQFLADLFLLMKVKISRSNIDYHLELPEETIMINADKEQLEQALINIIINAAEAIRDKGMITISLNLNPISIVITDNGEGISPEASEKLFTPFFSTKVDGQGVGLTLVREILHHHDIKFSLKSEGGLTRFSMTFPK